jgi:hypothetical protein
MFVPVQLAETYGAGSDKVKTARRLMDQAVGQTITALQDAYQGAFVSQVLLPHKVRVCACVRGCVCWVVRTCA